MMNNKCFLEVRDLTKIYALPGSSGAEGLRILDGLSLELDEAEVVIVTGESGSGKTTMLNILGGLDSADSGQVRIGDLQLHQLREQQLHRYRQESLGFIFQFHHLLRDFTALENAMLPALIAGEGKAPARERAMNLLKKVGLEDRANNYPYQLSGGERQRVAISRALINEPKLILADEPTGSLDEKRSREVEDLLFNLVREEKRTMIIVTHDSRLALRGDRHFHLSNGRLA